MPVPYFISFRTYGSWLHGSRPGSVDRAHNRLGGEFAPLCDARAEHERSIMLAAPVLLTPEGRTVTLQAIGGVCRHRGWNVHAINVRTNHVHTVVSTAHRPATPERVMVDFKAWATRRLIEAGCSPPGAAVWAHHGSTRYLNHEDGFAGACHYTMYEQEAERHDRGVWKEAWRALSDR
jgi:REP element-mobilizing transposase RayT